MLTISYFTTPRSRIFLVTLFSGTSYTITVSSVYRLRDLHLGHLISRRAPSLILASKRWQNLHLNSFKFKLSMVTFIYREVVGEISLYLGKEGRRRQKKAEEGKEGI